MIYRPILISLLIALSPLQADVIPPKQWEKVKEGMSEAQLIQVLGEPFKKFHSTWLFGPEIAECDVLSVPISYHIELKNGQVSYKVSPFANQSVIPFRVELSASGMPTKPRPLFPAENRTILHQHPIIDLRWSIVSGDHPMSYLLEVEQRNGSSWRPLLKGESDLPYYALHFPGKAELRWRIRGKNSRGSGSWSDWGSFTLKR